MLKQEKHIARCQKLIDIQIANHPNVDYSKILVPAHLYYSFAEPMSGIESYLLNVIGDCNDFAVSYYKLRKIYERRNSICELTSFSVEEEQIMKRLRNYRTSYNHIPESTHDAHLGLIDADLYESILMNPIERYQHDNVRLSFLMKLVENALSFQNDREVMRKAMFRDYAYLIGEKQEIYV